MNNREKNIDSLRIIFVSSIMYFTNNVINGILFVDIILYIAIIFLFSLLTIKLLWSWSLTRRIVQ